MATPDADQGALKNAMQKAIYGLQESRYTAGEDSLGCSSLMGFRRCLMLIFCVLIQIAVQCYRMGNTLHLSGPHTIKVNVGSR